jgi:mRNA-degrading endonuclease HigB of HigAB toxin-antitoxin module
MVSRSTSKTNTPSNKSMNLAKFLEPPQKKVTVQRAAPKSKVLNRERVRFEVAGGNYRLVVAFDFRRQVAFVKFVGTHAEYDRIDALTISQY